MFTRGLLRIAPEIWLRSRECGTVPGVAFHPLRRRDATGERGILVYI